MTPPADEATRTDALSYAAAVRQELDDLPAEELDELTGGLDADLLELAAESSTPLADRLGPASTYAAELRSAAGIGPRRRTALGRRLGRSRTAGGAEVWSPAVTRLQEQAWWAPVRDFAVTLRPAWWVLRAWVAFMAVSYVLNRYPLDGLPDTVTGWMILIGFVVISVQLGREASSQLPWLGRAVVAGNVAAAVLLPAVLQASSTYTDYDAFATASSSTAGLAVDGEPVTNIFPYDADGRPLTGVQLFDGAGRRLAVTEHSDWDRRVPQALVPYTDASGRRQWHVFPLYVGRLDPDSGAPRLGTVRAPSPPFLLAPAVTPPAVGRDGADASPEPTPSGAPTDQPAAPTATPGASPTDTGAITPTAPVPTPPTTAPPG